MTFKLGSKHLKREIKHHTPITKISRTRFFALFKASVHSFVSYFQILESKSDMRFGLSAEEYEFIEQTVVLPLAVRGAVVWCFGSRARGNQTQFSDLDLMIDCSSDLNSIISEMSEKLIESNFPYKVDLVELRRFAKSYLENFYRERVLWSANSP